MRLLGNIIWIVFGGWAIALEYIIGGIALCMTIVGIPFGIQCFKLAILGFAPFGQIPGALLIASMISDIKSNSWIQKIDQNWFFIVFFALIGGAIGILSKSFLFLISFLKSPTVSRGASWRVNLSQRSIMTFISFDITGS